MSGKSDIPSCEEVVAQLEAWSEGTLPDEASAPYEQHLHLCSPCANIASTYRALARIARAALEVRMPPEASERLQRALAARLRGKN